MRYVRLKSLTWWSSVAAISVGGVGLVCTGCSLGEFNTLVAVLNGSQDTSPTALIVLGFIGVGLNDKFERMKT